MSWLTQKYDVLIMFYEHIMEICLVKDIIKYNKKDIISDILV